jgi:hypothetical protein
LGSRRCRSSLRHRFLRGCGRTEQGMPNGEGSRTTRAPPLFGSLGDERSSRCNARLSPLLNVSSVCCRGSGQSPERSMRRIAKLSDVQRPQVVSLASGLVEVRLRVSSTWWSQLATQARAEGSTVAELVRDALVSLVPPDGATTVPLPPVTPDRVVQPYRTKTGSLSSLTAEQRSRAARGDRIFSPEDLRRISELGG